ncbi:MAG: hypothetical protein HEQ40_08735 [Lacibacter sp.]
MKRIVLYSLMFFLASAHADAQSFMNEWIDHGKTYYKFRTGEFGVHRITQAQLAAAGLGAVNAQHFQLWRNGQEVAIHTSVPTGALPSNGFIEFWGATSDGEWEKRLYLDPEKQINPFVSVFTDSVTWFLTVNTLTPNKRLIETANNLASGLPAEPYFMNRIRWGFRNIYNQGFAAVVGDYVYSSSYDAGEGYSTTEFRPANPFTFSFPNLGIAPNGPDATFYYTAAGRALNTRTVRVSINGTQISDREMNYFNIVKDQTTVPYSLISSNSATVQIRNTSPESTDRMVVGMYEFTYPRVFDFAGSPFFPFKMPASAVGNNLVISNFNGGSVAPVLYDLTNNLRIVAQSLGGNQYRVVIPPSATERELVMASVDPGQIKSTTPFAQRNFINYSNISNQADYIMISNPLVYNDNNGVNQVNEYRLYRSSVNGGGFNAKVYDVNELIDQFGWGIKYNALAIRNFLRFARQRFAVYPKYTLLIGKGVSLPNVRAIENRSAANRMNLVPTWGTPSSDMILAADEGDVVPKVPIGRLNVVDGTEVGEYLNKLKQYDTWQRNFSCDPDNELWKKKALHIGGANDYLGDQIQYHLGQYKLVAQDTSFGANIATLQKSSLTTIQTLSGEIVNDRFTNGFQLLTYFGHSSANTLEFNLDNPDNYPATGKYPIFLVNGCNAGNLFLADSMRFNGSYTLSEKYIVSSPDKGAIAFIASTHLGIVQYLNIYTEEVYNQFVRDSYGKSIGTILTNTIDTLISRFSIYDFYVRMHVEENTLHGDPALTFYHTPKPDYAIKPSYVKIAPQFISIAENKFSANIKVVNAARATGDSVKIEVQREFPNGSRQTVFNKNVKYIPFADSIDIDFTINALTDKGLNKIIVTVDGDGAIDEMCETNNSVVKEIFIYEDEVRPAYPYNFGIVNKQNLTYYASTANPLGSVRKYYFEIDTTEKFNSAFRKQDSVTSGGGSIAFKPSGITFSNNTVYYWRVGIKPDANTPVVWNGYSFVYRSTSDTGYNQSHFYQFTKNDFNDMVMDSSSRGLDYKSVSRKLAIKTGLFPYFRSIHNYVFLDLQVVDNWRCSFNVFSIYVFEPKSLRAWVNAPGGRFGSLDPMCGGYVRKFFEFPMEIQEYRNRARLFLEDSIPAGSIVLIVNQGTGQGGGFVNPNSAFIQQWQNDTLTYGSGKSIYHTFIRNGLTDINKFTKNLPFAFLYEKGNPQILRQFIGENENDYIDVIVDLPAKLTQGSVESPWLGPSKEWKNFTWDGFYKGGQKPNDSVYFELYGKTPAGAEHKLATVTNAKDTSLSFIDAKMYPQLKMKLNSKGDISLTPYQLQYWRLTGSAYPEGAIAPNVLFKAKDTLELGEPLNFSVAFRNISEAAFDSLKLKLVLTDNNNVPVTIDLPKKKPLVSGDTITVSYTIDTKNRQGNNLLYLMVNPDNDQPEQYLFNNFLYKSFYVKGDKINPWLDVTFDGVHILNRDIVSSKPHILIKLKDDSRFMALNDTTGLKIKVRYPGNPGVIREFKLGTDSARFSPASLTNGENTATVDLYPNFLADGDYELTVSGNDRSGNKAGELEYNVAFQVINKPMISNLLNYPNPFTTSTAFVFTLTGSQVPQNIRIQILTVTGKVIREITKEELGPIRIGRNITEFKWDGTDQFGNKLANGIYLYRVITNLNGQSLDQYKAAGDQTDQFFNRGYGKMYLMR